MNAIKGKNLPVYGQGLQVRDWLYVDDHARALVCVILKGKVGETYNIGGNNEMRNIDVVNIICDILQEICSVKPNGILHFRELITYVEDRPGHDLRYAIDARKIESELGWTPKESFDSGIRKTITWYLQNEKWWVRVLNGNYHGERLGLNK